ncbi:putative twin-arginine translocation pathway signal protein [Burkholderia pseudomallei]|nr:putative twin-arginine translocation pathway signal protein [Burkholderia pseudomallei]
MKVASRSAFGLATVATGTAVSLSILTGLQRGGTWPERLVWVSVGIVLVVSAHLLPTLIRTAPLAARGVAGVLWIGCMAGACNGHATFFLLAQRHAGEQRANAIAPVATIHSGRDLTVVMAERASVVAQLAAVEAKRCTGDCRTLNSHRVTLTAKLDALNAEADDIRRSEAERDQVIAQRDALLADPVTSRLAALLGTTAARMEILSGLAFAAVLEGVACLLWTVALRPSPITSAVPNATLAAVTPVAAVTTSMEPAVTDVTADKAAKAVVRRTTPSSQETPGTPIESLPGTVVTDDELTQLAQEIAAGHVRATVADIRRHLGCSQAKAATLRRQLTATTPAA